MLISVIVPAYNEAKTIAITLNAIRTVAVPGFEFEVIVIDDGSKDGTLEILKANSDLYSVLIARPKNGGKGAAVLDGLRRATGDYVIFQDADLEYDPAEYAALLMPVRDVGADVVMGSRFLAPRYTRVHYFFHKIGNYVITFLLNLIYNKTFTDIYCCYLLYRRSLLDPDRLRSVGWEQHAEILCHLCQTAENIYEVPVSYRGRTYADGKKIRAKHIIGVIGMIFRKRFM